LIYSFIPPGTITQAKRRANWKFLSRQRHRIGAVSALRLHVTLFNIGVRLTETRHQSIWNATAILLQYSVAHLIREASNGQKIKLTSLIPLVFSIVFKQEPARKSPEKLITIDSYR
jgi:hypothetical protein